MRMMATTPKQIQWKMLALHYGGDDVVVCPSIMWRKV